MILTTLLMVSSGIAALVNGYYSRKQYAAAREEDRTRYLQDRAENNARHEQDKVDSQAKFDKDFKLREDRFLWEKGEALSAHRRRFDERMEDFNRQSLRDQQSRSFNRLSQVFNTSPDAWAHDPYAHANPDVKSLRLLLQISNNQAAGHRIIENAVNSAIRKYVKNDEGTPVHFPTGAWAPGTQTGSWVASELHLWNPSIPTLIIRADPCANDQYQLHADIFGFPLGDRAFEQGIEMGTIPNDQKIMEQTLSLIALSVSDIYFLSNYGKMPQLPRLLSQLLPEEIADPKGAEAIQGIVTNYQATVNGLLIEDPKTGLPASVRLAESLMNLPDKRYALQQVQQIELMARDFIHRVPALTQRLQALYRLMDRPEDANRLANAAANGQAGRRVSFLEKNI